MTQDELIAVIQQTKDKWGRETVAAMLKAIDAQNIKWKGTLKRSIMYEQDTTPDGDIQFLMASYGKYVDEGVGPAGINRRSIDKKKISGIAFYLKPWATSKGLNAWAVATKIQRKGIKPKPFFTSVIESRVPVLGEMITKSIADAMEKSITDSNK